MTPKYHGMLEIHIAVLLFGLAGLFGKLLTLPALVIVFGRTLFASLTLGAILFCSSISLRAESRQDLAVLVRALDNFLSRHSDFNRCHRIAHIFHISFIRHFHGALFFQRKIASF